MPRAKSDDRKSSEDLDAEIAKLKKELEDKRKKRDAAKRREDAEAAQARAIEEAQFNKDFVEISRWIFLSDYAHSQDTVFMLIEEIMADPEAKAEYLTKQNRKIDWEITTVETAQTEDALTDRYADQAVEGSEQADGLLMGSYTDQTGVPPA